MKSFNKIVFITLFILTIIGMIGLAFTGPEINRRASESQSIIQQSRNRINLCELLNWDSFYVEHDFFALDWYVAAMINDSLITESEANNTIFKYLIENSKKVSETRGRSDVDEYILFKDRSEIFIEWYVVDLFLEESFLYNHTYELVVFQYGENTEPFILQFDILLMANLVDDYETNILIPLERCEERFIWAEALLIGSISLIALWKNKEEKSFLLTYKEEEIEVKRKSRAGKRELPLDPHLIGPLVLIPNSYGLILFGLFQILL